MSNKIILFIIITLSIQLCNSCSRNNLQLSNETDLLPTSIIKTQDNREFYAKDAELEIIRNCIENNPEFNNIEIGGEAHNRNTTNARLITQRTKPLRAFLHKSANFIIEYEIGINPKGDVVIVRVVNHQGTISDELAKRSAINLMNMQFQPDESAHCLAIGKYTITVEGEPLN